MKHLILFLKEQEIAYERDVSLAHKSWIKTGGLCSFWIMPNTQSQLIEVCRYLYSKCEAFEVVGLTSNIFYHSSYNPKIVISTSKINKYVIQDQLAVCDCGVKVMKFAKDCLNKGYKGFYGLVGLPGTIAASVYNNAGCFDCSISSMLESIDVLTPSGEIKTLFRDQLLYRHRSSAFKRKEIQGVILSVKLKLERAESVEAEKMRAEETVKYRKTNQEGPSKNLGSVFSIMKRKNNFRNRLVRLIKRIAKLLGVKNDRALDKHLLLMLYGYTSLSPYISERNVNTFVWRDHVAEALFETYKQFMSEVYDNLTIEIEERK